MSRRNSHEDGPFVLYWTAFNSSLVDSTYNGKTQRNATLTGQLQSCNNNDKELMYKKSVMHKQSCFFTN